MYRCYACDAPAQVNCPCTKSQQETTTDDRPIVVDGVEFQSNHKINIASGEDAIPQYYSEYA